jgi:hypothetical protein
MKIERTVRNRLESLEPGEVFSPSSGEDNRLYMVLGPGFPTPPEKVGVVDLSDGTTYHLDWDLLVVPQDVTLKVTD